MTTRAKAGSTPAFTSPTQLMPPAIRMYTGHQVMPNLRNTPAATMPPAVSRSQSGCTSVE